MMNKTISSAKLLWVKQFILGIFSNYAYADSPQSAIIQSAITKKIKVRKIVKLILHSIQHCAHLSWKWEQNWEEGGVCISKLGTGSIDFSFDSALCAFLMKKGAKLSGGGLHILIWDRAKAILKVHARSTTPHFIYWMSPHGGQIWNFRWFRK